MQFSVSHISAGEDPGNDKLPFVFLSFLERKHAQCGVIMVRESQTAFVEMWVERRGKQKLSLLHGTQVSQSLV